MSASEGQWVPVAPLEEIPEGEARTWEVGDVPMAICRVGGTVHCIEDICPHDLGPLGDGPLEGHEIVCPRHGARFDVRDGRVLCLPALCGVRSFPAEVRDGTVWIRWPEPGSG